MSELFGDKDTLMIYHYMFPRHAGDSRAGPTRGPFAGLPLEEGPCPSCTALIDMWEDTMPHFEGLGGNLVVVTRAPIERVVAFARDKGWQHTKLLSAAHCGFRRDYGGDGADGQPVPLMTVFKRWPDGTMRLHWASELYFAPTDPGQDPRHLGTVEPLWTLFDLTPGGRPAADEQIEYGSCGLPSWTKTHCKSITPTEGQSWLPLTSAAHESMKSRTGMRRSSWRRATASWLGERPWTGRQTMPGRS
jgi:predicted dithiol-disulfide oxidoreductase (DUF899 family)